MKKGHSDRNRASGIKKHPIADVLRLFSIPDYATTSSLELCDALLRTMQDGFSLLDTEGRHLYVNPALCSMTGFSLEELVGTTPPYLYWPPEEHERIQQALTETMDGKSESFELVFMRKNGERFPVMVSPYSVESQDGTVIGYSATVKDITSLLKADKALLKAHQKLHLHVEQTPMAVIEWDLDFRVTQWNPAAEAIFGFSYYEAIGQHASFIIPKKARHFVDVVWQNLISNHGGERSTNENLRKDGSIIMCEWYNTPLVNEQGTVTGAASLAMDISERIKTEEDLKTLNRELETRVRKRTQELEKTLEVLIQRNSQLKTLTIKLGEAEDKERRRIARLIHDNYQQMLVAAKMKLDAIQNPGPDDNNVKTSRIVQKLLDDVIAGSRSLTADLSPPILEDAGLSASLEWLARWMKEYHNLHVTIEQPNDEIKVDSDTKQIVFHAIRELLFNVVKHSGVNEAKVVIGQNNGSLLISVIDRGVGFNLLKEVKDAPSSFGLQNIREQVLLIDGHLRVESRPGEETVITLTIPTVITSETSQEGHTSPPSETGKRAKPAQQEDNSIEILVADDHGLVRQGLIEVLESRPELKVIGEAANGIEAVQKALALQPDIVLMDVTMPEMTGLEATEQIIRSHPEIKIIGLSMHEKIEMADQMRRAGACDYKSKNDPIEELITAIHQAAGAKSSR